MLKGIEPAGPGRLALGGVGGWAVVGPGYEVGAGLADPDSPGGLRARMDHEHPGEELEEPFGLSQNAVPLDALVRAIEIASLDLLGETDVPPALQPDAFVLR